MIRVAIAGASGYTGAELIRLLINHPEVQLTGLTSRQYAGKAISEVFPSLYGRIDLCCSELVVDQLAEVADVVFTALPHQSAMAVIPALLKAGLRVVDLSADYRLRDASIYEAWYQPHSSPELLTEAVYGLPELFREQIGRSRLVANPGCYPTSAALALLPLLEQQMVETDGIVIDSKSGSSGAGRGAKQGSLFCEVNEGFKAYGVGAHRHTPEIEQTLSGVAGEDVVVSFTPHLLPVNRGILSTCYAGLRTPLSSARILEVYARRYADEPFVRVLPEGVLPNVNAVAGSNYCDLGLVADQRTGKVIVVAAIDNLVKGASGQAVQNMNLMYQLEETAGLTGLAAFP